MSNKTMKCRRCGKMSEPITFGYCRKCAKELGAKFMDECKHIQQTIISGHNTTFHTCCECGKKWEE